MGLCIPDGESGHIPEGDRLVLVLARVVDPVTARQVVGILTGMGR